MKQHFSKNSKFCCEIDLMQVIYQIYECINSIGKIEYQQLFYLRIAYLG